MLKSKQSQPKLRRKWKKQKRPRSSSENQGTKPLLLNPSHPLQDLLLSMKGLHLCPLIPGLCVTQSPSPCPGQPVLQSDQLVHGHLQDPRGQGHGHTKDRDHDRHEDAREALVPAHLNYTLHTWHAMCRRTMSMRSLVFMVMLRQWTCQWIASTIYQEALPMWNLKNLMVLRRPWNIWMVDRLMDKRSLPKWYYHRDHVNLDLTAVLVHPGDGHHHLGEDLHHDLEAPTVL